MKERHRNDATCGVNLGMIVTPMLDMSFQILAFFIMTYNPSILEGNVYGALLPPARTEGNPNPVPEPKDPVDKEPDLGETVLVVVKAIGKGAVERKRVDGEPSQIFVKAMADVDLALVCDTDEPIADSLKRLGAKLKALAPVGGKGGTIRLDCDGNLKHHCLMQVYDACKGAGFQNVSFVAPNPKDARKK